MSEMCCTRLAEYIQDAENRNSLYVTATNEPHYAMQSICQSVAPSGLIVQELSVKIFCMIPKLSKPKGQGPVEAVVT